MTTRAKFLCNSVRKFADWHDKTRFMYEAEFSAVTSGSEENKQFFAFTPSGSVKLATYKEDRFQPGQEYFLDFSEV